MNKQFNYRDVDSAPSFYPSVDFGYLDIKKAK